MLIEIAKPEMTYLYCTPPIHRPPKLNYSTMHQYWILDRAQTYFDILMRSVLQHAWRMSLWTTCHASRRLALDWYGSLNAITSRQHYDDKSRLLAVLSIFLIKQNAYFMPNEAYQPKSFPQRQFGKNVIVERSFQAAWSDRLKWLQ